MLRSGVLAEPERSMNRERVDEALARAKATGKRAGWSEISENFEEDLDHPSNGGNLGFRTWPSYLEVGAIVVQGVRAANRTFNRRPVGDR